MKVKIYSTPTCVKCKMLKAMFDKKGIEYEECQDVLLMQNMGIMSVPMVELSNGELIGFEDASKLTN